MLLQDIHNHITLNGSQWKMDLVVMQASNTDQIRFINQNYYMINGPEISLTSF